MVVLAFTIVFVNGDRTDRGSAIGENQETTIVPSIQRFNLELLGGSIWCPLPLNSVMEHS